MVYKTKIKVRNENNFKSLIITNPHTKNPCVVKKWFLKVAKVQSRVIGAIVQRVIYIGRLRILHLEKVYYTEVALASVNCGYNFKMVIGLCIDLASLVFLRTLSF